jgi:uncharacterized radical SAM superfamily Fe-S cluster-containing enzyme
MIPRALNFGYCDTCKQPVPVTHTIREKNVYLTKECARCGTSETLLSTDAEMWQRKRRLTGYDQQPPGKGICALNCTTCKHHPQQPMLIFLDVTNRCNMNCPICLANIPAMGFEFEPPLEYFDKIFRHVSALRPRPGIQLFGGEPTVRDDLIDIIRLARSCGLSMRVVTNGIRLADEHYCKELLAAGPQLMFAFDGRSEHIYATLRNSAEFYHQKMKALENVHKHRKKKITIMSVAARGINDGNIADLVAMCHEFRGTIAALDFIPLTITWAPGKVENAQETSMEDVEKMVAAAIPGVEFVPATLLRRFATFLDYFNIGRITFGGAHPNCESVSVLISDGKRYLPLTHYVKRPMFDLVNELLLKDEMLGKKLDALKRNVLGSALTKLGLFNIVARAIIILSLLKIARKDVKVQNALGGKPLRKSLIVALGLLRGKKFKHLLRQNTRMHGILRLMVLPFEDWRSLESARLEGCPAAFAYEDPETTEVKLMPVCAWPLLKNDILRRTSARYGIATTSKRAPASPATGTGAPTPPRLRGQAAGAAREEPLKK